MNIAFEEITLFRVQLHQFVYPMVTDLESRFTKLLKFKRVVDFKEDKEKKQIMITIKESSFNFKEAQDLVEEVLRDLLSNSLYRESLLINSVPRVKEILETLETTSFSLLYNITTITTKVSNDTLIIQL